MSSETSNTQPAPSGQPPTPQTNGHPEVKRRRLPIRPLIILLVLTIAYVWWRHSQPPDVPSNEIALSGRIEGDDSAVATKPGGRVVDIRVREGDHVKAGDVIAIVDDAQIKAREDQAREALQESEFQVAVQQKQIPILTQQLDQSQLAVDQAQLDTRGKIVQAQQQITAADASIAQAEAKVRSSQRQIGVLQQQLEQSRLAVGQASLDSQGRVTQAEEQVAAAEAQVSQAVAQHRQAEMDANRYTLLASEGAVSHQTAEQANTNEVSLRASAAAAQKQLDAARGALTTAQANLANPAIRRSQEEAAREQIRQAREDLAAANAEVVQLKAVRRQAIGNLTATKALLSNPALKVSQEASIRDQMAQANSSIASAMATEKQAKAKLAEARADRNDLQVTAPFDGTVATRVAEPGEVLAPGATVITLVDLSKVYLRGYIPEGQIGRVRVGQDARIFLDSSPNRPVDAFVSRIDPEASFTPENTYFRDDRVLQVVGVKLQVKSGIGFAKPGMPADGEVLTGGTWTLEKKR